MKILLSLIFIFSAHARSKCNMDLYIGSVSIDQNSYSAAQSIPISMRRTQYNNFLCYLYFYDFGKGNANSYQRVLENSNGDTISYNLYKPNDFQNILTELSSMNQNSDAIWDWDFNAYQNYQKSFSLNINYNNTLIYPAGNYTDSVRVRLYSGLPFNDPVLEDTATFNINFSIQPSIALSLVDVGSPFTDGDTVQLMDFGVITTGEIMEADLKVRSNAGYRVYMKSENKGKLKHQTLNDKISYTMKANTTNVNLNAGGKGDKVADKSGVTPAGGDNIRIKVTLGNPGNANTGVYTDFVTITAETKN